MTASNSAPDAPATAAPHTAEPGEQFSLVRRVVQQKMYASILRSRLLRERLSLKNHGNDVAEIAACYALREHDLVIASPLALGAHVARSLPLQEIAGRDALRKSRKKPNPDELWSLPASVGQAVVGLIGHPSRVALLPCEEFSSDHEWRSTLRFAGHHRLPIIFVFRNHQSATGARTLDLRTTYAEFGVPAITVDAADAIAVYRVATEACHNARVGRGATVIDAVSVDAVPSLASGDPLSLLEAYMRRHSAWNETWLADVKKSERDAVSRVAQ